LLICFNNSIITIKQKTDFDERYKSLVKILKGESSKGIKPIHIDVEKLFIYPFDILQFIEVLKSEGLDIIYCQPILTIDW
jgi:hypothetical protein